MKYLKRRSEFLVDNKISLPKPINKNEINLPINESKWDASGGQGPMGNDINWGDSLVGRLFNSIARKLVIGVNKGRMALINRQINEAFERLLTEGKIQSSNVNKKEIETIKVSYFLERLTAAVHQGLKVKYLIELTEESINLAEENDELQEKDLLLKQLNDFLEFLNQFDPEEGEDLDEEITGMSKEELAKGPDIETQGEGWETEGEALKGMVIMIKSLAGIIDEKDQTLTTAQSEKEEEVKSGDINYVYNEIIKAVKEIDGSFNNNLLDEKSAIKWPVLEISDNKIIYRKSKNLVELAEDKKIIVNIPKWSDPKEGGKGWVGKSKPTLLPISRENIKRVASYIVSNLKKLDAELKGEKTVDIGKSEIDWFNKNIKGLWLVKKSDGGNYYITEIGECNENGYVKFKNPKVKTQADTNIKKVLNKENIIVKTEKEAKSHLSKLTGGQKEEPSEKEYKELEPISESFILEKTELSGEETDANQALEKLKRQIKTLISDDKGIAITSEFLKNLSDFSKIKEKGNKNLLKKLFDKVKQQYEKVPDFDDLYETVSPKKVSESFDVISDSSKIETVADKIARFAKRSMQFVGENLYGTMGNLGKHLQKFNEEFGKLLNTDLKIEESIYFNDRDLYMINKKRVSSYSNFMMLNESVTQRIITYYDKNVNYNKWKIENKEIVTQIDRQLENVKIDKLPIEPIIEIVRLINRAYKIHTVEMIPSGRKGGKVSNRTYQEYEYMGEGSSGPRPAQDGGVEPGPGPFRNKSLFNQFESNLLDIKKDKRFEPLFRKEVEIESTSKDGKKTKAGDGKVLLKFINEILDGQSLYKQGAQRRFFAEYFQFEISDKELSAPKIPGGGGDPKRDDDDDKTKKCTFIVPTKSSIDRDDVGKVYILENTRENKKRYMVVISEDGGLFFKSSEDSKYINEYLQGYDIDNFKENNISAESLLAKVKKGYEIKSGVKIKGIDLKNYNNTKTADVKDGDYFKFDKINVLVESENKNIAIRLKDPEKLSAGPEDAPFTELKDKFR